MLHSSLSKSHVKELLRKKCVLYTPANWTCMQDWTWFWTKVWESTIYSYLQWFQIWQLGISISRVESRDLAWLRWPQSGSVSGDHGKDDAWKSRQGSPEMTVGVEKVLASQLSRHLTQIVDVQLSWEESSPLSDGKNSQYPLFLFNFGGWKIQPSSSVCNTESTRWTRVWEHLFVS